MHLIDSHCHLDFPAFDLDRPQVLHRCHARGINDIIVPGVEAQHWPRLLQLCKATPGLHPALGLHPLFMEQHKAGDLTRLNGLIHTQRPIAIGEIGLDFSSEHANRTTQQYLFEAQLHIASEAGLPVILHSRRAHDQTLNTLKKFNLPGGIAHAFNGSLQQAQQYIELGFKLGFGGMLTYERSTRLRALAKALPLESIVLETDAPDMSVAAHRGERNSPEYLVDCLDALATIRGEDRERIAMQTTANICPLLAKSKKTAPSSLATPQPPPRIG